MSRPNALPVRQDAPGSTIPPSHEELGYCARCGCIQPRIAFELVQEAGTDGVILVCRGCVR